MIIIKITAINLIITHKKRISNMNMHEFVTVKDQLLEFLKAHQNEVVDSEKINSNTRFHSLPNGVIEACIDEMKADNVIKVQNVKSKYLLSITDSGKMFLGMGGYAKRLIEEKKHRAMVDAKSAPLCMPGTLYKRNRQIALINNTVSALSVLSSILFKRI